MISDNGKPKRFKETCNSVNFYTNTVTLKTLGAKEDCAGLNFRIMALVYNYNYTVLSGYW